MADTIINPHSSLIIVISSINIETRTSFIPGVTLSIFEVEHKMSRVLYDLFDNFLLMIRIPYEIEVRSGFNLDHLILLGDIGKSPFFSESSVIFVRRLLGW